MRIRQLDRRRITIPERHRYSESNRFGVYFDSIHCSDILWVCDDHPDRDRYLIATKWNDSKSLYSIPKNHLDGDSKEVLEDLKRTTKRTLL